MTAWRTLWRANLIWVVGWLAGAVAHAAMTAPPLAITHVDSAAGASGTLVRIWGDFAQGDLVQQPLEIQLLIRELGSGTGFVRFSVLSGGFEGTAAALAGGVGADNVLDAVSASTASTEARLLLVAPDRIEVRVPADFPSGPAEAVAFLIYEGTPILSNAVRFPL